MQRKSIGHSRKKHGEHGASDFKMVALLEKIGPVNSGDVLPKIATTETAERRRDVHRAGVVRQKHAAKFHQRHQLAQRSLAGQIMNDE